jgi:Mlc titration factor MtfA (ptsG expression regulator)
MAADSRGQSPPPSPAAEVQSPPLAKSRADLIASALLAIMLGAGLGWAVERATRSLVAAIAVGAIVLVLAFRLLTARRRRAHSLLSEPIPAHWEATLLERFPWFELVGPSDRLPFLQDVRLFLREQRISAVNCQMGEGDRLLVAATAVFMVRGWPGFRYPTLREILIYPSAFDAESYEFDEEGEHIGQLLAAGPLILSLPDLRQAFTGEDIVNVVVHEFAHYLDATMAPEAGAFASDFDAEAQRLLADRRLQKRVAAGQSPLDDYALSDCQELFAVSSEVFFEDPLLLRELHGDIYTWLAEFYRQDLAGKLDRAGMTE